MGKNSDQMPLEFEIQDLRLRLKTSKLETIEECQLLRAEIQQLYLNLARITRPGRYAIKRRKKNKDTKNEAVTPEVIPPDLDVNEYLNQTKEHEENIENQPDINYENDYDTSVMPINPGSETPISSKAMVYQAACRFNSNHEKVTPENIEKRSRTFEQRLSQVAERMKDRRQKWLESQEKKRWWKVW